MTMRLFAQILALHVPIFPHSTGGQKPDDILLPIVRTVHWAMLSPRVWVRKLVVLKLRLLPQWAMDPSRFAAEKWKQSSRYNLPINMIVFSNAVFGWIKAGQHSGFAERYHNVDFSRTDHAAVASAYGIKSWTVDDPTKLAGIFQEAVAHDGPTMVDIISQPLHEANAPVSEWVA